MDTPAIEPERSRDLSEQLDGGRLDVVINGVGENRTECDSLAPLISHVLAVFYYLTGKVVEVDDPRNSPWCIVSFDRDARKLVVEEVVEKAGDS